MFQNRTDSTKVNGNGKSKVGSLNLPKNWIYDYFEILLNEEENIGIKLEESIDENFAELLRPLFKNKKKIPKSQQGDIRKIIQAILKNMDSLKTGDELKKFVENNFPEFEIITTDYENH